MVDCKDYKVIENSHDRDNFDVSIIVVNWNAGKYLQETIEFVVSKTKDISFELIVVDNNSNKEDESYTYIENLLSTWNNFVFVKSFVNLGFARANNIGMKIAKGRNLLILNPDVVFHNNVIGCLSNYLDANKEVGMVGPKVLNPDGSFQQPCLRGKPYPKDTLFHIVGLAKAFPNNEYFNGYAMWNADRDVINECWALSGCCMMVKKSLFEQIGGMDEQFFMYQEETDWGIRTKNVGKKVVYNPNAVVTHYQGVTTKKNQAKSVLIFTQSMMKFFKKHFWNDYNIFQKSFWVVLIWGNFVLKYIKVLAKKEN